MDDEEASSATRDAVGEQEQVRQGRQRRITPQQQEEEPQTQQEYTNDATWNDLYRVCCIHSPQEWCMISLAIAGFLLTWYFFLLGLALLASGAQVMSTCWVGAELFAEQQEESFNPISGVMVGILAAVLLQSSSVTISIAIYLVGNVITIEQGIYIVMGANIGASVTDTIVAMGQMGNRDQLERALQGAFVGDMFVDLMTVAILLPFEVITGYLKKFAENLTENANPVNAETWQSPVRKLVSPLANRVLISNIRIVKQVAVGKNECSDFYPMECDALVDPPTYTSCHQRFGLIACDEQSGVCPAFFRSDATLQDDKLSGGIVFAIGIMIVFIGVLVMILILEKLLRRIISSQVLYKATKNMNGCLAISFGYLAIALGAGITMLFQSPIITSSTLMPLVGVGALRLEQVYPITLGSNLGAALTGITVAMCSDSIQALQMAVVNLMFSVTGIAMFYPIPLMRKIPIYTARQVSRGVRIWSGFPLVYLGLVFLLMPWILFKLTAHFDHDAKGFDVLASISLLFLVPAMVYLVCHDIQSMNRRQDTEEGDTVAEDEDDEDFEGDDDEIKF